VASAGVPDASPEASAPLATEPPPVADPASPTEAELDAIVAFLIPHVEAAAGARFETVPPARLATREALADVLETETREVIGRIYDVPDSMIEEMAQGARAGVPGLLGKYATSTGAVYLEPANTLSSARSHPELGDDGPMDVILLIMAHELTHALQDQVADLEARWTRLEDLDHFDGARGITEGHANWVTLRVARALDREDAFWALSAGQGWGRDGLENPGAFTVWMLYGQGMAFSEHHAAEGGTDRLWEILRAPPRSTTMLFRPERYAARLARPRDLAGVLTGVEQSLTRTTWMVADTHLGEATLREELVGLDAERVDRTLAGIDQGHELRLSHAGDARYGPRSASILVVRFTTAQAGREVVDLLSDGLEAQAEARTAQEARLAEMIPGGTARRWVVESRPYDRIEGDAVIRRVVGPVSDSGARLSREESQALWVVRGEQLVMVRVSGFRPGNRLDKAVDQIFERLAQAGLNPEPDTDAP